MKRVKGKQRRDVSTTVDLPEDLDVDSEVELLICADGYDEVRERKESNNCETVTVDLSGNDPGDDFGDDSDPADVVEPASLISDGRSDHHDERCSGGELI